VCGRLRSAPFPGGVLDSYREVAAALAAAMRGLGVEAQAEPPRASAASAGIVCFERVSAHEICVGGRKLIGSAQLRRRGGFLQHGSIRLAPSALHERVFGRPAEGPRFTDLHSVLGRRVSCADVDDALVTAFAAHFGAELRRGELTAAERERAAAYRRDKHGCREWIETGRVGAAVAPVAGD
jgi:lipoate-protein ligase A